VGRRPRTTETAASSSTQPPSTSPSTINETVLRCSPLARARSARESGCRRRIRSKTIRWLMSRATSLEAGRSLDVPTRGMAG